MRLWIVLREGSDKDRFSLRGIFSSKEIAVAACEDEKDFVSEEQLDRPYTNIDTNFANTFRPLASRQTSKR